MLNDKYWESFKITYNMVLKSKSSYIKMQITNNDAKFWHLVE